MIFVPLLYAVKYESIHFHFQNKKNDTNVLRNKDENNSGQKRTQAKLKKEDQAGNVISDDKRNTV